MNQYRPRQTRQLLTSRKFEPAMQSRRIMDYEGYDGLARALFEEHEDPLVLCDSQTKLVLDVNAAAQRLCGIGLKDLLDTPVLNLFRLSLVVFCVFLFVISLDRVGFAEPKVQILSPKDGSRITQDQKSIFVSGKVAREAGRSERVDIFLVIDISGSTALYAGADLGEADQPPPLSDRECIARHRHDCRALRRPRR